MDALKKKRRTIKGHVTRSRTMLEGIIGQVIGDTIDIRKISELEAALDNYKKYASALEEITEQMLSLLDDTSSDFPALKKAYLDSIAEVNQIQIKYEGEIKAFHRLIVGAQARESLIANQTGADLNASFHWSGSGSKGTKLEEIPVPRFNGDFEDFPSFKGLFDNLVHNNADLAPVQKLYYLKRSLADGKAYRLVRDFSITDEAYAEAYAAVNGRFNNKRTIVRTWFRKLRNLKNIASSSKICLLIDTIDSILQGLKAAGEKIDDTFSRYVAYLVSTRLDKKTDFENSYISNKSYPLYNDLHKFLQTRLFAVEERNSEGTSSSPSSSKSNQSKIVPFKPSLTAKLVPVVKSSYVVANQSKTKVDKCSLCSKEDHPIFLCENFRSKPPKERFDVVKLNRLCIICLRTGHSVKNCPDSSSRYRCKCGNPHNYMLHFGEPKQKKDEQSPSSIESKRDEESASGISNDTNTTQGSRTTFSCSSSEESREVILLPSAVVRFKCGDITGTARLLLDSCSQPTMVSDSFVRKFKLPTIESHTRIKGVALNSFGCSNAVKLSLVSRDRNFVVDIDADIVPASCLTYKASVAFSPKILEQLKGLNMGEPKFVNSSAHIDSVDIVIGVKYYEDCVFNQTLKIDTLKLRRSKFGWVVSGDAPIPSKRKEQFSGLTLNEINDNLSRFWTVENAEPSSQSMTSEEALCVQHFDNNYSYAEDGKFVVKLPLKIDPSQIASTRARAENALKCVENKLSQDLRSAYSDFMVEYRSLNHMSKVKNEDTNIAASKYYLPHREV